VIGATEVHPVTSRTRQLSPSASMVLGGQPPGRVDHCQRYFFLKTVRSSGCEHTMRGGAVAARQAHNLKVRGSNPLPATELQRLKRNSKKAVPFQPCAQLPKWRNWQTRYVQGVVSIRSCGFKSHLRHSKIRFPTHESVDRGIFFIDLLLLIIFIVFV
jgi:hypothetical protein